LRRNILGRIRILAAGLRLQPHLAGFPNLAEQIAGVTDLSISWSETLVLARRRAMSTLCMKKELCIASRALQNMEHQAASPDRGNDLMQPFEKQQIRAKDTIAQAVIGAHKSGNLSV
jgi:hypothetical protein